MKDIQLLITAIENLHLIASRAYWAGMQHCGSDVTDECSECNSHDICVADKNIQDALKAIKGGA